MILNGVQVILCNTSHAGNIGAVARAMKTMGLSRLILVEPMVMIDDSSYALACNAKDVIANAQIMDSLDQALADSNLAYALTARQRALVSNPLTIKDSVAEIYTNIGTQQKVSLVFGSEKNGLTIKQLEKCNRLITIPANPEYASLNLAQAVQVVSYEVYNYCLNQQKLLATEATKKKDTRDLATIADIQGVLKHMNQLFSASGYYAQKNIVPERLQRRLQHMLYKANLECAEVDLLRGILSYYLKHETEN